MLNEKNEGLTWEEIFHPQDISELRTSEVCVMSLKQFDEAFAKYTESVKA